MLNTSKEVTRRSLQTRPKITKSTLNQKNSLKKYAQYFKIKNNSRFVLGKPDKVCRLDPKTIKKKSEH
jgi:hypothetical protein